MLSTPVLRHHDTHVSGGQWAAGAGQWGHFPKNMLRIGSMHLEPLLETRDLLLWLVQSKTPPALSWRTLVNSALVLSS